MDSEYVELDWDGDVATLTVDRPEALNALNVETLEAMRDAIAEAQAEDARVLVVTGAGDDAFIAGADIKYMQELSTEEAQAWGALGHEVANALATFPGATVAAVNGFAFGGEIGRAHV